ncbi:hypothetical protein NFI96_024160, partial [Prochilodus magdalenae]
FAECNLTAQSLETLSAALGKENSSLKELDLSNSDLQDSGLEKLSAGLKSSHCKLEIFRLAVCKLSYQSCDVLGTVLQTETSCLKELDLNKNDLQDAGVEMLSVGLKSSHCKLEKLRLSICNFTIKSCKSLISALQTKISFLKELDLCSNELQDSAGELLSAGLKSSHCNLEMLRLAFCNLDVKTCENLESLLKLENSSLKELDLSNNDVQDSGIELLSAGLQSSPCQLEILRLSGCMITEKGCFSLASALSSNPSHLKELDLTYNHPGESGVKLISARVEDPQCALKTLRLEHGDSCEVTLDPNTAYRELSLSDGNRKVENVENQSTGSPTRRHIKARLNFARDNLKHEGKHFHGGKIAIICILVFAVVISAFIAYIFKDKFSKKKLSPVECSVTTYMRLQSKHVKKEFDLKKFNTSEEGYRRLIPSISNYRQAQFAGCNLTAQSLETLCATLETENSSLRELDLSNGDLQDSGLDKLSAGLKSSHCKLEILRLAMCKLSYQSCDVLGAVLQTETSCLKELDLSENNLQDAGVEKLSAGLKSSHCKLKILRLAECKLNYQSCDVLGAVLQTETSCLKELDLSENKLQDAGVEKLSVGLKNSHCKLEILRLAWCGLAKSTCGNLGSALQSKTWPLKGLDLSKNNLEDSGMSSLSAGFMKSQCKLEILSVGTLPKRRLRLKMCCRGAPRSAAQDFSSLGHTLSGPAAFLNGVSSAISLWEGSMNNRRRRLSICNFTAESCKSLISALQTKISFLKELDLCSNELQDSAGELLSAGLKTGDCKLEILRLALCNLDDKVYENLESLLKLENSSLKELDLSNNDVQNSGVELLSAGLMSSHCKLEILRLSGCMITEKGCSSLASALSSNPSYLKELDLIYNHPGESGRKLLSARLEDPQCSLSTLRLEHGGENRIKPGLKKCKFSVTSRRSQTRIASKPDIIQSLRSYFTELQKELTWSLSLVKQQQQFCRVRTDPWPVSQSSHGAGDSCEVTLDPNTAHRSLSLSDGNRKVEYGRDQSYPDHPERFDGWYQVLSRESLTGRCYWEAEWSGLEVHISVSYKSISRKGRGADCRFGWNVKSWSLYCSNNSYSVRHNNIITAVSVPPFDCKRVGVYVDCPAGTLSFYRVSSDPHTLTHLHTFYTSFTEPLYAGFYVYGTVCVSE